MYLIEIVKISLQEITKNPLRSFLSLLGVTIGVTALLSMITLNEGMKEQMLKVMEQHGGANTIFIDPTTPLNMAGRSRQGAPDYKYDLTMDIVEKLDERFEEPVSPAILHAGHLSLSNKLGFRYGVIGTTPNAVLQISEELVQGRFLCDLDLEKSSQVIVINKDLGDALGTGDNILGATVDISGYPMEIVGVLNSGDDIYIPITTAINKTLGKKTLDVIRISSFTAEGAEALTEQLRKFLPTLTNNKEYYGIRSPKDFIERLYRARTAFNRMLIGVTLISMLVGGIGIMNIMLASIKERIHEIGIRKAIGAKNRHIFIQLMLESVFICLLGGILGIALGIYGGESAVKYFIQSTYSSNLKAAISIYSILLAVGFSALVGITFGTYPAIKAAKINPIDALRYE